MKTITIKLITLLILSFPFLNLKSQTRKITMENEWVLFAKSFDFSATFKSELSRQLEEKLYILNNLNRNQKNPIKLIIGMEEINQTISNEYVFISAQVYINDIDEMFPVSICWKSADFTDLKTIQKSNLNNKKVDFEWCKDFPFEELKIALNTEKEYEKVNNLKYIINAKYYPDLVINFQTNSTLNKNESELLENIFKKNKKVYVSNFIENSIMLDFQIDSMNFKEEDFYKDIEYLKSSIKEISELEFSNKINNIEIK